MMKALREIGSDLKRSIKPFFISSASPDAVLAKVNATVCTKIPGIRSWTYPPGWPDAIEPPNTNLKRSTNITG
jgi:hypothetical protein